jgi:hypothetical protein
LWPKLLREAYGELAKELLCKPVPIAGAEAPSVEKLLAERGDPAIGRVLQAAYGENFRPGDLGRLVQFAARMVASPGQQTRIVVFLDQLEQLTDIWHHDEGQRAEIRGLLDMLQSWNQRTEFRNTVTWVLSGAPAFFAAVDSSGHMGSTAQAGRGAQRINVGPLAPPELRRWVAQECAPERGNYEMDPDVPSELFRVSGGHPWIAAVYGSRLAQVGAETPERVLACADLKVAEEQLLEDREQLERVTRRLIGESVDADPETRECYVLLRLCSELAQHTSVSERDLASEIQKRDRKAASVLDERVAPALDRLRGMGFLEERRAEDGERLYRPWTPFFERLFRSRWFGGGSVEDALGKIRNDVPVPRERQVRHCLEPIGRTPDDWRLDFIDQLERIVAAREVPGALSRLLSFAANCGPISMVRSGSTQTYWRIGLGKNSLEESRYVLREVELTLDDRYGGEAWERFSLKGFIPGSMRSTISQLNTLIEEACQSGNEQAGADSIRRALICLSDEGASSLHDGVRTSIEAKASVSWQRQGVSINFDPESTIEVVPLVDVPLWIRQTRIWDELSLSMWSSSKNEIEVLYGLRTIGGRAAYSIRDKISRDDNGSVEIRGIALTIQWQPALVPPMGSAGDNAFVNFALGLRPRLLDILCFGYLFVREPDSKARAPICRYLDFSGLLTDEAPQRFLEDHGTPGDDWQRFGHHPEDYPFGMSVVFPVCVERGT